VARFGHARLELTPARVSRIHEMGGTVLGSSRGNQDVGEMVDTLERERIDILFTIGGDGTLRGAHAIAGEVARRGLPIAVVASRRRSTTTSRSSSSRSASRPPPRRRAARPTPRTARRPARATASAWSS